MADSFSDATLRFLQRMFGYDAAKESPRHSSPRVVIKSEDEELPAHSRRKLQVTANNVSRNFAVASWAIRKHLDFVTTFRFASNNAEEVIADEATGEEQAVHAERSQLDDDIKGIIEEATKAERCDSAARHDLDTMLRIVEARGTLSGDHALIELTDGTMQSLESDRIRNIEGRDWSKAGTAVKKNEIKHGVHIDTRGRALRYAVHSRADGGRSGGYKFERWVSAKDVILTGYFDRTDQVRGVSPMAPSLLTLQGLYEGFDFALAKARLAQLFGFKTIRKGLDGLGNVTNTGTDDRPEYEIELGKGPWNIDLEPGDDVEIMQADVPGDSFQAYSELMISIALLALDLPWNFFKVDATNFFGSRAALNLYLQSCIPKRKRNVYIRDRWTRRQLQLAILKRRLRLPRTMTIDDLRWSWVAAGMPWWNPKQESDGALQNIGAGLDNPQRICQETNTNFFDNIDRIAEAVKYAESKGVRLNFAPQQAFTISQNGATE